MPNAPGRRLRLAALGGTAALLLLTPASALAAFGQHALRYGTPYHAEVRVLQVELDRLGYRLPVDGVFGYGTLVAVRSFQRAHHLIANGIVAARTFDVLRALSHETSRGATARGQVYVVQAGDTFSSIAAQFRLSAAALETANPGASPADLQVGQSILIPPGADSPQYPPASSFGAQLARLALKYLGVRYVWGGTDPSVGFDCSGFVYFLSHKLGVDLPRTSSEQYQYGVAVPPADLEPGDLVFFDTDFFASHVGIYEGNGMFAHAENFGTVTQLTSLHDPYWSSRYIGAKRILP